MHSSSSALPSLPQAPPSPPCSSGKPSSGDRHHPRSRTVLRRRSGSPHRRCDHTAECAASSDHSCRSARSRSRTQAHPKISCVGAGIIFGRSEPVSAADVVICTAPRAVSTARATIFASSHPCRASIFSRRRAPVLHVSGHIRLSPLE